MASVRSNVSQEEKGPAWQIAKLFPDQGDWSESDYLLLTERSNRLAEFTDGRIEVLPMPTMVHQRIVRYLIGLLLSLVGNRGEVLFAPLRVRLRSGKFREPDVLFMLAEHADRMNNEFWEGADLVMEIVNEDDPERDLQTKRLEYAEAGIPEYWIVDPRMKTVTVLKLEEGRYVTYSEGAMPARCDRHCSTGSRRTLRRFSRRRVSETRWVEEFLVAHRRFTQLGTKPQESFLTAGLDPGREPLRFDK